MTFWVNSAISAASAGGVCGLVMNCFLRLDVESSRVQDVQHSPVQLGIRVRVHESVLADGTHVPENTLNGRIGITRGTAAGAVENFHGLPRDRPRAHARPDFRPLLEFPFRTLGAFASTRATGRFAWNSAWSIFVIASATCRWVSGAARRLP